jgi:hypothetical protein
VSRRAIHFWCIALLAVVFAVDVVTPQHFVVAILFNAPIALSGLLMDRRLTYRIALAALAATVLGGYLGGMHDHDRWGTIDATNRFLAALSFLLVGMLTTAASSSAQQVGELSARQARLEREAPIRKAIETIRGLLNSELVYRAAANLATAAFDVDAAVVFAVEYASQPPTEYRAARGGEVEFVAARKPPEIISLVQRALDAADPVALDHADPLSRLVLDTIGAGTALAARIVDRDRPYGVLVVARKGTERPFDAPARDLLRSYVDQVATALLQARLFIRLAEKNEQLADANSASPRAAT